MRWVFNYCRFSMLLRRTRGPVRSQISVWRSIVYLVFLLSQPLPPEPFFEPDEEFGRCFPEAFLCSIADSADSTAHFLGNQPLRRTEGALASLSPLGLFSSSVPFWTSAVLATLSPYNQCFFHRVTLTRSPASNGILGSSVQGGRHPTLNPKENTGQTAPL